MRCLLLGFLLIILSVTLACSFSPSPPFDEPDDSVILFDRGVRALGHYAADDLVCVLDIPHNHGSDWFDNLAYVFTQNSYCDNDEARSLVLKGVKAGLKILVYDESTCSRSGATTKIVVKQDLTRKVINTFEVAVNSPEVDVILLQNGDLNGEVSCVEVGFHL